MSSNKEIQNIVETAIELFRVNPASEVTYSKIEEAMGRKSGHVFMYFEHKADLVSACVETVADRIVIEMAQVLGESGQVVGRFLNMDRVIKDNISLLGHIENGVDRNLKEASIPSAARTQIYKDLEEALVSFIEDGNAQGVFHADNVKEKAAFIAFGLQGLRNCCTNELKKQAAFYQCIESILGTDLKTYLKIAA